MSPFQRVMCTTALGARTMKRLSCEIGPVSVGQGNLVLIAGPCVAESLDLCRTVARALKEICARLGIGYVFKASFDKANRSSGGGLPRAGDRQGIAWLARRCDRRLDLPVLSDVHEVAQVAPAARAWTSCKSPRSSAARPTCWWPRARRASRSTSRRGSSWPRGT